MSLMLLLLGGCLTLDGFVHNNLPCSQVSQASCEDKESTWDQVCTPCEQDYDWSRDYDWFPETLSEGESIRPIAPELAQAVPIETPDGAVLDAWFIPAHGEHPDNDQVTLVYNHGNYAGIEHYLPRIRMAHEAGFNVYVWDYRGYGKSLPEKPPDGPTWWADARLARDAATQLAPDPDKVLIYANSLGGLPAVEMALRAPGCALMLEAGLTSIESIAGSNSGMFVPDSMLTSGEFDNLEKIKAYSGPLLAMIGTDDEVFREEDTQTLVDNAAAPADMKELWLLEGVHHGITSVGIPDASYGDWAARMDAFMDRTGACR